MGRRAIGLGSWSSARDEEVGFLVGRARGWEIGVVRQGLENLGFMREDKGIRSWGLGRLRVAGVHLVVGMAMGGHTEREEDQLWE